MNRAGGRIIGPSRKLHAQCEKRIAMGAAKLPGVLQPIKPLIPE